MLCMPATDKLWVIGCLKIHSTNPLEWLNKEVKRRADVVGIFPNGAHIRRLIEAVLMEQNEEWRLQHRYLP